MPRRKRSGAEKKAGLSPGTPVYVGPKRFESTSITVFDYDQEHLEEKSLETLDSCETYKASPSVTWINVDGLQEVEVVKQLGEHFGFHPLVQEDIVNTTQRPKFDDFGAQLFVI